jgi:pimeloyl-ACP methyl ester carboxylesterase
MDEFSRAKRFVELDETRVAYYEQGRGEPVLFVHGCPFSSFIWRNVIPSIAATGRRCLAPDLLGLGDTETPTGADWSLPAQVAMVVRFLDAVGVERAHLVSHDHGGAVAQMLAAEHPHRIDKLVISNAEAYDNWPSAEERPFVKATQIPIVGRITLWAWSRPRLLRHTLARSKAVADPTVLSAELIDGYRRANLSDKRRRARTRRFLAGQIDPDNNRCTLDALDGLRHFDRPTMLLWGAADPHFGPEWAHRLADDIPGVERVELLAGAGHLVMEDQPEQVAELLRDFLDTESRQ